MKNPTGPYDRARLLDFLSEQGKNEKDWDHYKPYVPGEKKGKVWQPPPIAQSTKDDDEFLVSTEWDDLLDNASESEIVELAGEFDLSFIVLNFINKSFFLVSAILGFTGLINQVQYHAAVTEKNIPSTTGSWNGTTFID